MRQYDIIIAGGGCAGLSLLYQILNSPLKQSSVLLVDRERKVENDHTWSFWSRGDSPFEELITHRWHRVLLYERGTQPLQRSLAPYTYRSLHAAHLYSFMHTLIKNNPQVEVCIGTIDAVSSNQQRATVVVNGESYLASWVFNSLLDKELITTVQQNPATILQHFLGWRITTPAPAFDPHTVTLFDFRVDQGNDVRFVYILPYSSNEALVEYTLFSQRASEYEHYTAPLKHYIATHISKHYTVLEEERGVIPMSTHRFTRRASPRVMNIGTRGGMVKPSTGYAFQRIQNDSLHICRSLVAHGTPFDIPSAPPRYRTFDAMILDIFRRTPQLAPAILCRLFARTKSDQIFAFLDEEQGIVANLPIMWRMPWIPFIKAYLAVKTKRRSV